VYISIPLSFSFFSSYISGGMGMGDGVRFTFFNDSDFFLLGGRALSFSSVVGVLSF